MAMTKPEVIALLWENQNERGMANWKKRRADSAELTSFGLGLTQLRKLAKQNGRDHELAQQLWQNDIYDAKVIGPIDYGDDNNCEPLNVHKHLTSDYLKQKLGV